MITLCVIMVGLSGLEPPTSRLSGARSNQLSYKPIWSSVVRSLNSTWWRWWDSNPWPPACRAGALPTELHPHKGSLLLHPVKGQGCGVGHDLPSHAVASVVLSALQSLTSVFGMGTGGPSALIWPTDRIFGPWKLNNSFSWNLACQIRASVFRPVSHSP